MSSPFGQDVFASASVRPSVCVSVCQSIAVLEFHAETINWSIADRQYVVWACECVGLYAMWFCLTGDDNCFCYPRHQWWNMDGSVNTACRVVVYSVHQKPPAVFWHFFPKRLGIFLISFYTPIIWSFIHEMTNFYSIISNNDEVMPYHLAILSVTTRRIFTFHYNFNFYVC